MCRVHLGLDLGGTNFRMGLVDASNQLHVNHITSSSFFEAQRDPMGALISTVESFLCASDHKDYVLESLSLGVPSTVDLSRRRILSTTNLAGWTNIPAAKILEDHFGVPVLLEKDTNLLMAHDLWSLKLGQPSVAMGVYVGTGLGNAIFYEGRPFIGSHGVSGELGHIPVRGNIKPCGCGLVGCAETLASGRFLECAFAAGELDLPTDLPFGDMFCAFDSSPVLHKFLDDLALSISTEVNIVDPSVVILGGGVIAMKEFPRRNLIDAVLRTVRRPTPADELVFSYSAGSQFSGVIGGAILSRITLKKGLLL